MGAAVRSAHGGNMNANEIFARFSPLVQDFIYANGWETLRPIQIEAARVIFESDDNLILCSDTASGKTEAVFFPILSEMEQTHTGTVEVLYIAPLKSLINDQFERIDTLLSDSGIPVFHWHGDVASSHKNKLIKNPAGILQITPESLESMLMNRHSDIVRLFGGLRYVIIDEIHTLMGADRGNQILCQLDRIREIIGYHPRRIGLSATIGDPELARKWLTGHSGRNTQIPPCGAGKSKWRLALEHFYIDENTKERDSSPAEYPEKRIDIDAGYEYLYDCVKDKKSIVFSNIYEAVRDSNGQFAPNLEAGSYYAQARIAYTNKLELSDFASIEFDHLATFSGYTGIVLKIQLDNSVYQRLNPSIYLSQESAIASGRCYIRFRMSSLNDAEYAISYLKDGEIVLSVTKGLLVNEENGFLTTYPEFWEQAAEKSGKKISFNAIGGPCTSYELVAHDQTEVAFCGREFKTLEFLKSLLGTEYYHISVTSDIRGLEAAVALKNGYALGIALTVGLNKKQLGKDSELHYNSQAAIFFEAAKEMQKLLRLFDAKENSYYIGLGDLYVTVYGGRTRLVGILLGEGNDIDEAKAKLQGVTLESLVIIGRVAKAVKILIQKDGLKTADFPLLLQVFRGQ